MASIKTLLGTDSIKTSRITLNENFAALNQELTEISELLVDFENNNGSSFNGTVTFNLIPNQTETYDLGSPLLRFRDIYLSNNTIYMGQNSISMSNGNMLVNGGSLATNSKLLEEVAERARLLGIETASRNQAIAGISNEVTSLANANASIVQTLTNLNTSFDDEITAAVNAERLARISALSDITETLTTLSDANEATSELITNLSSSFNTDAIDAEISTLTNALSGINETLTTLSDNNEATSSLVTDLDSSFSSQISAETLARTTALSTINETLTTLSDANETTAQLVTNLGSSFDSEISAETLARTTAISGINQTLTTLNNANSATAQSVTNLSASFNSALSTETLARTTAIAGVESSITAVATANQASATATTNLIAELEEQTAGVTQTMNASIDAITNKINAQYTLEVDANGNVAGMKLGADENGSSIAFTADSFKVSTGGPNGEILTPFSIIDGQVAFNGSVSFGSGEGARGPAGPAGPMGPQGIAGTNGLDGADGLPGAPGADGVSTYFHIAYADNASGGGFSQSAVGKLYIGTYVDTTAADAASGSNLWNWQLVKGADGLNGENGIPGTNGANGQTSYLHIAYANNINGTSGFSTTDATGKLYLGTYTDFTEADSTNPALYTWVLVKGADGTNGLNGTNGLPGAQGANGVSSYFHVAYADNASGGGFSQSATGKLYIGTYVDNTLADAAAGSSLWKWQLVKGSDGANGTNGANGIAGTNGTNGQTSYLHIAYANNSSGTSGFSTTDSTSKLYLGTYTDFTLADSENPALYSWTLIKGETGPQGPAPDTSQFLTTSTTIDGAKITTGIIKNGNFVPANDNWDTYSNTGFGINLDLGAINARNFYIAPDGNAKFKGDIDSDGATIKGSPMTDLFKVEPALDEFQVLRPVLKMRDDAYFGNTRFSTFRNSVDTLGYNYDSFRNEYNSFSNNVQNRFDQYLEPQPTTLSHQYIKRNDVALEIGDLVKLDENNELVKASSVKDASIVGILWEEIDFIIQPAPLNEYSTEETDTSEKDYQYRDSFGNKIPLADRDQKSVWKVASLGDSVDAASGLQGIKVCNQNGPVLKGDLLCSSDIPGYAMKQPVEYAIIGFDNNVPQYEERQTVTSYTLGKCMEDCAFDSNGKATGIYGYLYCG
jgi:hypothetical protein